MSSNWKNPFLNKEKLNLIQNDKEENALDMEVKNESDLKKHVKSTFSKDMR